MVRMPAESVSRHARVGLAAAAFAVYALSFVPLYRLAGSGVSALVLMPVVVIAWLLGSWGGLVAGVLSVPLNAGLLYLVGEPGVTLLLEPGALEGPALVVVVGAVFGLLRDLGLQLHRQLEQWRRATAELRESQDRYRVVVEETSEGVVLVDAASKQILEGNPAFRRLAGYDAEALRERTLYDLLPQTRDEIDRGTESIRRSGHHFAGEKRLRRRDGSLTEIEVALDVIEYGGREVFCCVLRDITERKRARELLARRTEQLQGALGELETFTYSVSHDLRTPLLTIHGFATHLLEDQGMSLDEGGRDFLRRIVGAADRMDVLINDLLAYGRVGRANVELQPTGAERVVSEALEHLSHMVEQRRADITVARPLPRAMADPTILMQVVENLLSNALKFVPPERTPRVRVYGETRQDRVRLWVEDNGIGIAPEHRQRIFRVFERLNPTDAYPGTGVGLAIVQKGVERMGGRAGVESQPGQGSRFWIELAAPGKEEAAAV